MSDRRCLVQSALLVGTGKQARFMPLLVGILTTLIALFVYASVSAIQMSRAWQEATSGTLTVQLDGGTTPENQAKVLAWLQQQPEIASATPLAAEDNAALLEPWIGDVSVLPDGLKTVPQLIDIKLHRDRTANSSVWQEALEKIVAGAKVDDHQRWLGDSLMVARALRHLCLAMVCLLFIALAVTIGLATRMLLAVNAPVVDVLHRIGAEDVYIERQFARAALKLTLVGSLIGVIAAGGCLGIMMGVLSRTTFQEMLIILPFSFSHFFALFLLPLLTGILAWGASTWVVRRYLLRTR